MKKVGIRYLVIVLGILFILSGKASAINITVDGSVSDWLIDPTIPHWIPGDSSSTATGNIGSPLTGTSNGINYTIEDAVGTNGYVGPGYGGQTYDVEAIYAHVTADMLYVAVVTGFPSGGTTSYDAGDIAFSFGSSTSPEYTYGLALRDHGNLVKDALYKVSGNNDWEFGLDYWAGSCGPTIIKDTASTQLVATGLSMAYVQLNTEHWVIEAAIPSSLFGSDWFAGNTVTVHWAMTCGNDHLETSASVPVPEPTTMMLFSTGLALLGTLGRKKIMK